MKNILKGCLALILLISLTSNAQNFRGKAVYQSKTTIDLKLDSSRVSIEQQQRIKDRMKSMLENVYELDFNATESVYKVEEKLDQPNASGGGRGMRFMGSILGGVLYKNTKTKTYSQEQELMGKEFLVKDSLEILNWEFKDESKIIGKHLSFKATAKKTVPNIAMRFGRENQEQPKDSLKEIEIVAWYTPEIPVIHGPSSYWGLPGLILELNADNTQIVCTKIIINPQDKSDIKIPKKGDVVSQDEFEEIRTKKMKEMREMYGGDRRGNQGGRRAR